MQYFIDPAQYEPVADYSVSRVFFRQRRNFRLSHVIKVIGNNPVGGCIVKLDPDPGFLAERLPQEDIRRFKVSRIVNGSMAKDEYLGLLQQSNIFIAPRQYEGIGMSFLEAMAMGMVVVGMNQPILNEYVLHGENGLLLESGGLSVEFGDIERLGRRARLDCEQGFLRWQDEKRSIVRYTLENAA